MHVGRVMDMYVPDMMAEILSSIEFSFCGHWLGFNVLLRSRLHSLFARRSEVHLVGQKLT